jgi:hypothetical protein
MANNMGFFLSPASINITEPIKKYINEDGFEHGRIDGESSLGNWG